MRADLARRHRIAVGALLGLGIGDAIGSLNSVPPSVCGDRCEFLPSWTEITDVALQTAELACKGQPVPMDVSADAAVAPAIRAAATGGSPPLLMDPGAAAMFGLVERAMAPRFDLATSGAAGLDELADAVLVAAGPVDLFDRLLRGDHSPADIATAGALAGIHWGPAAFPAAWITYLAGPAGRFHYRLRQVVGLAERLLGEEAPVPPEPRRWTGPRQVLPKLWLSNLPAARQFAERHPEGGIISLCPTRGTFDDYPRRREFMLHDAPGAAANPRLAAQLDEVLDTIDAFHSADRDVLVHCHHGASRTGLVLRALLMRDEGLPAEAATAEAQARWRPTSTWNKAFGAELARRESG